MMMILMILIVMHLLVVCPRRGRGKGGGHPWKFVFKMLHQGRNFGIDNNPLFVCHFVKIIEKSLRKASKRDGILTKCRPKVLGVKLPSGKLKCPNSHRFTCPSLFWGRPLA